MFCVSLAMSTSFLKALPGKLDIKYSLYKGADQTVTHDRAHKAINIK